ncbi:hypothetical protein [Nocardiopsis lucentensis]|uniref:hypothetical protein n=1 Tax=Nocardiopsis lucentensis TaxID=53441 RepID=UPI000349EA15|nr:hypothetical protein [Nocardiopsis lucentensis]
MTVAAMGADVLARHLERGREPDPRAFFRDLAKVTDAPWSMSAAADLGYSGVRGRRTIATHMANRYVTRVQAAAATDPEVARGFIRAISLVDPPQKLMGPSIMGRVLMGGRPGGPAGGPVRPTDRGLTR